MEKLVTMFELDSVATGEPIRTVPGSLLAAARYTAEPSKNKPVEADVLRTMLPELVNELRIITQKLADDGYDFANDHGAVSIEKATQYLRECQRDALGFDLLSYSGDVAVLADKIYDAIDPDDYATNLELTLKTEIMSTFMYSRRSARQVRQTHFDDLSLERDIDNGADFLVRRIESNPNEVRREVTRTLKYLQSDEVTAMLQHYGAISETSPEDVPSDTSEIILPHQELDFTILPAGTDMVEFAREIVERLSNAEKAHVDLERIRVLEEVREIWGKHVSYFAHGKKTGKTMKLEKSDQAADTENTDESKAEKESDMMVDEDYIVLVMQDMDSRGDIFGEHALAISPIAGKHAAYLTRHDVSAGTWREVLPLPKRIAQDVGARDLKFMPAAGHAPYDLMREKVRALLDCDADDFANTLRMRGDGSYRVQSTKRDMGKLATKLPA